MTEAKIPKEHIFQEPRSDTCGPCCLAMVYALRKKQVRLEDILRDFKQDKMGDATYTAQLARHLEKNGLRTTVTVSSSKIVSPAWSGLSKTELIENLKLWLTLHPRDFWHLNNLYLLFYLQEGGTLNIASYTVGSLQAMLDKGSMLIVCVDEDWLWGHRLNRTPDDIVIDEAAGKLEGHFVVVTGYEENKFHILDPFPTNIKGRHGAYDVEAEKLLNASLTWDPEILEVAK